MFHNLNHKHITIYIAGNFRELCSVATIRGSFFLCVKGAGYTDFM